MKIFLTAGSDARAVRRCEELRAKGQDVTLEDIKGAMLTRDENDRNRTEAPAIAAADAVLLDNSSYTQEETLACALKIIRSKLCIDES